MSEDKIYIISNPSEDPETHGKYIDDIINELLDRVQINNRSSNINNCKVIGHEAEFITLLDQSYKSYLRGMYYTTVCLCTMANERLCYDLIDKSGITIDGKSLNSSEKQPIFHLSFTRLLEFCFAVGLIKEEKTMNKMRSLNDLRNKYIHPTFKKHPNDEDKYIIDPENDAKNSLNKLIDIINETVP